MTHQNPTPSDARIIDALLAFYRAGSRGLPSSTDRAVSYCMDAQRGWVQRGRVNATRDRWVTHQSRNWVLSQAGREELERRIGILSMVRKELSFSTAGMYTTMNGRRRYAARPGL